MTAPPIKRTVANCRRKVRYSDEYGARAGAQHFCQQRGVESVGIYQCTQCHGWHMTHNAARKFRVTATDLFLQPSYLKGATTP